MATIERPTAPGSAPAGLGGDGHNVVLATGSYKVVGTRPVRHDGVEKVTGRAIYGADIKLPGLLYGKVLRSPHAHARILRINVDRALAHPGVKAVVTGADLPLAQDHLLLYGEGGGNVRYMQDNILAHEKVLYKGHAVAAVAATDVYTAEEALDLIEVEYEVLPPVIDVREAMQEGAPLLHEQLRTRSLGQVSERPSNIASHFQHLLGDPDRAFAEAAVIVEREFTTTMVHQGYIEPHNATAVWNPDDTITIWSSTQGAFGVREQCADILQHPVSKIRAIPLEIGGGFGGKINVYLEPVAALLSRKSGGRPVKLVMTRAEVFQASGPAPGSWIRVKLGATRDGRLIAAEATLAMEAGAYPGSNVGEAARCIFACYDIPNGRIDGYDVVVNKPRTTPYRAPGAPQAAFAAEQVIDELAERLGIDPLDFRIMNSAKEGTRTIDGRRFPRIGALEVLQAAKAHPHYSAPLEGPHRGRGVAHGYWFNIGRPSSCTISVNPDGTVNLAEGSTDIGGTRASIAMQAAEVLGIGAHDVRPAVVDTSAIGYTGTTEGSRTTFATGIAAIEAAKDVLAQLKQRAARIWEVPPETVDYRDGTFHTTADPAKHLSFKQLAALLEETGGPISATASVDPAAPGGAFATVIVDVAVDPETGKTQVLRGTIVQDAGKAVHPSYVEGQMQGGMVQGLGWALHEAYQFNARGELQNASLLDYRLPTALDVPGIDTVIVEVPNPGHPFGVRGVGEVSIVPPAAAVANALHRALGGVRLTSLPMNPAAILEALGKA